MMKKLKSLADFLDNKKEEQELYLNDERRRYFRAQKGLYSKDPDIFNFIYLVKKWPEFLGGQSNYLAQNTCPLKINNKVLTIVTRHQVFSTELSYMAPILLKRLSEEFPGLARHVNKINFVNSDRFFQEKDVKDAKALKAESKKLHPFSPEFQMAKRKAQTLFEFSESEDEELQEIFLKLFLDKN